MYQEYSMNREKSLELFQECKKLIMIKECYANIFYVVVHKKRMFTSGEWKIAYGYVRIFSDGFYMARHCFIVNSQGEAIDPTWFASEEEHERSEDNYKSYISFKIFDSIEEYVNLILENDNLPDLLKPLWSYDLQLEEQWAKKEGMLLIR
ncbi:hypothetical protein [Paenibacillus terrae]|uniref:Uncharacterized protein n=1 Tax=Paenibacillus terrae TaxID=159743 RepID=A0A0D7WV83_9BACL|nr:hypothetical protein [Paenibacillus terrae]KJD42628.1 hypothetical protein QD47_27130 [Paenibacillus terrae]